jgi:hypothetical protein
LKIGVLVMQNNIKVIGVDELIPIGS